jgi:hypothetical protein
MESAVFYSGYPTSVSIHLVPKDALEGTENSPTETPIWATLKNIR